MRVTLGSAIVLLLAVLIASGSSCDGGATRAGPKAKIACSGQRAGNYDIYVINADGSEQRRLTRHPTRNPAGSNGDQSPAWSPDGRRIAFQRGLGYANSEIYVVNVDGSGLQRLTRSPAYEDFPVWSPDGRSIAFVSERDDSSNSKIYVMDADGSGRRRLMRSPSFNDHPAWSPDGRRIAFTRTFSDPSDSEAYDSEIYIINTDGSGLRRLTRRPVQSPGSEDPAWSPDGRSLAFVHSPTGEYSEINVMNTDGSGRRRLIPGDHRPAWSPDGRRIAFIRNPVLTSESDIYVINADGSGLRRLTQNGRSYEPAWSPDGRRIAYESGEHIFVSNADGSGLRRLMRGRCSWPAWSP